MHYIKYKKWWGTHHFRDAGKSWLDNGFYCPFPEDTDSYKEYWDEQEHYIKNGFTWEGQRVAGLMYLYLNYCPFKVKKTRKLTLPNFWAVDADYFENLEYVLGMDMRLPLEERMRRPVGFSAAKSRQVGASLKGVVPLLYNMNFVPFSYNYIGAYLEKDALKTLGMYMNYHNHLFKYTDFGKRFASRDAGRSYVTGYFEEVNGERILAGFQSRLEIVTFKDNPEKGVGGGCDLFIIEEAAMHPQLLKSVTYIEPACKDGDFTTGNILVYGAASSRIITPDFSELHYNPSAYNFLAFENHVDPKPIYDECGYFLPNYACREGYIDEDGNPDCEGAIKARDAELLKLKNTNLEQYNEKVGQYPNNGTEMFGGRGRKRFDTALIETAIMRLMKSGFTGTNVELYPDHTRPTGINWRLSDKTPINMWPTPKNADLNGCVVLYEPPDPNPPAGLYISSLDSYNQDSSQTTSLGSIQIFKRVSGLSSEKTHRVLVAEYMARPTGPFGKHDFYRICAWLLQMYRATCLPENEDQELVPWFYVNGYDHLLADQPDIIRSIIPGSGVKRLKGIHATTPLIVAAENKIARYLYEKIGTVVNEKGEILEERFGAFRIPSLGLLQELKEYTHDSNKNFDRVRTFGWLLLYEEESTNKEIENPENDDFDEMLVGTDKFFKNRR